MLEFRVRRIALKETYTIGKLELKKDGQWVYLCDTLEDTVRDINKNGIFDGKEVKIPGKTAIPYGKYKITMNVVSPKYSNFRRYPFARPYKGYMPRLLNVNSFDGILIHPGNKANHTDGCILVGKNKVKGQVIDSQQCWHSLMQTYLWPAKKSGEEITIEIL